TDSGDEQRLREADLNRHLSNGKKTEKKAASETEKAALKPASDKKEKKEKKNKDKNKAPIEFGSEEDLLLKQAMNYFKGITASPEKKSDETETKS
ncbi:MAG: peptidase S41, partial [Nitrosomonas sp.]|nr:peptidase S41 [Nitrosomonas sp.]